MTRIVIIGGSGHVGTYLVPKLVDRGYEVINVSRGEAKPYKAHSAWKKVKQIKADRKAEEEKGVFGERIANLSPDIVIDMIAFEPNQTDQMIKALNGKISLYVFCSTVWVYGHSIAVPALESDYYAPALEPYGQKKKQMEETLMHAAHTQGFPVTSFRPGHIVGEGWKCVNPQGNFDTGVFDAIGRGDELCLPDTGLATVHHVHADDCAQWIMCAIDNRSAAIGECFNTVSSQALTLRGYAEAMYRWYGREPRLTYKPMDDWKASVTKDAADATWSHASHSPNASIEKSRRRLGYSPRYTSLEAVQQCVTSLMDQGIVQKRQE